MSEGLIQLRRFATAVMIKYLSCAGTGASCGKGNVHLETSFR